MEEDSFLQEEAAHQPGSWDQFAGNAHLIKQPTSYNELLYTTPIPKNIPEDWCQKATLISTDQQTPDTGHRNDGDEETTHARVLIRTNHSSRTTQPLMFQFRKKFPVASHRPHLRVLKDKFGALRNLRRRDRKPTQEQSDRP